MKRWRCGAGVPADLVEQGKFMLQIVGTMMSRGLLVAALLFAAAPDAQAEGRRHGLSSFGDLKYAPDFQHFDYVNPDAPKGGRIAIGIPDRTFDSFNGFILKGSPARGLGLEAEAGLQPGLLFDSLMARALDEPDAVYGLVAHAAELAHDRRSVTFHLRPEARFSDGSPLTADDVAASFSLLREKGHPIIQASLRDIRAAKVIDPHTVRFEFEGPFLRDLPLIAATLPIFSKAYYERRPFEESSLDKPLGSGPYEIAAFNQGTFVTYRRRKDYWGAGLPVNAGRYNFDEVRYEYYRDRAVGLEAFKAGAYDFREEYTSKSWATEYDIPAVREKRVLLLTLPDGSPSGAQGMFFNTRREKFKDIRVRRALGYAFDFEWINKNLFHGLYIRTQSYFENSDLKAEGPPSVEQLALLDPFREKLAPDVLGEAWQPPVSDGSGQDRRNLRLAAALLDEAGWKVRDGVRVNAQGEPFTIEFLTIDAVFERVLAPFVKNLELLGVKTHMRRVDPGQYEERRNTLDFDVYSQRFALSPTPGPESRAFWSSATANTPGTFNLAGVDDPVVDALLGRLLEAKSRNEMRTAARALDRVLRAGQYWIPEWFKASHNLAVWDKFGRPDAKPRYDLGVVDTWWFDADRASKTERASQAAAGQSPAAENAR